jgi:hypothetical protein
LVIVVVAHVRRRITQFRRRQHEPLHDLRWSTLCEEVAKLEVGLREGNLVPLVSAATAT